MQATTTGFSLCCRLGRSSAGLLAALTFLTVLSGCSPIRLVNGLSPSGHYQMAQGVAYGAAGRQRLDLYTPRDAGRPAPIIVFFYGGGWKDGKKKNYEFVASSLTRAGYVVVIPDYRLHPEVVFPGFIEDAAMAVAWAIENGDKYGADPGKLFVMGHSAGAHIAAMLSTDPRYLSAHGMTLSQLSGFIGLSGPYDFLPLESGYLTEVFPEAARAASQPIGFVSSEMPPTLLIHGSDDDVVGDGNSVRMAEHIERVGGSVTLKLYAGVGHAAVAAALSPPLDFANNTLEDCLAFLDSRSSD